MNICWLNPKLFVIPTLIVLFATGSVRAQGKGTAKEARPTAREVAERAIVVNAAYSFRFHPHSGEKASKTAIRELEKEQLRTLRWLQSTELWSAANEWEQRVFESPVGSLTPEDLAIIQSQRDELSALLFGLGIEEALSQSARSRSNSRAVAAVPALGQSVDAFIAKASLRPVEELQRARDVADLWFLRASVQERVDAESLPPPEHLDDMAEEIRENLLSIGLTPDPIDDSRAFYHELIRFTAHWAHQENLAPQPVQDDLPVDGRPYRSLDKTSRTVLATRAEERVKTLNWLLGKASAQ